MSALRGKRMFEEEDTVLTLNDKLPRDVARGVNRDVARGIKRDVARGIKRDVARGVAEETSNRDVEAELRESGYTPVSRIVVDQDGELEGQYIKALNLYGQYIYIDLDAKGLVSTDGSEVIYTEVLNSTELPLLDAYNCVKSSDCGVASECVNGICTMKRESGRRYPRQNFLKSERAGDVSTYANMGDTILSYPIVRLSDIRANPERSLLAQNAATTQLRNQRNEALLADVEEMGNLLNQLVAEFNDFEELRSELTTRVATDLAQLEVDNLSYIQNPPRNEEERNQAEAILDDLMRRNEIVIDILECSKKVTDLNDTLKKAISVIQSSKKECLKHVNV